MRKCYSFVTFLFACLIGSQALAASPEDCSNDAAHCAYYLGLAQNANHGRYIKVIFNDGDTESFCAIDGIMQIAQSAAAESPGQNIDHYYICTDSSGKSCELVNADNYTTVESNGKYSSTPLNTPIDFSSFVNNFPECHVISKQLSKHS